MVERSIESLTRNHHWLYHRNSALHLRRLIAMGLTHAATTWALA